jgi:hypothetical protein
MSSNIYVLTVKVGTAMVKSRRDILFEQSKQIEVEMEIRRNAEERLRRRRYTPMTKAQFRYWVMRDLGLLEGYYDDFE